MPTLINTFETGLANGAALTAANSGTGVAGAPLDAVATGTGTSLVFSTAHPAHGGLSALATIGASAGQPAYVEWSTSLLPGGAFTALMYTRIGIWTDAPPTSQDFAIIRGLFGANQRWRVSYTNAGKIAIFGNGAVVATSTLTLAASTHYRVEASAAASAVQANCSMTVRIYAGDSTTPLETLEASNFVMGGPIDRVRFGVSAAVGSVAATRLWLDDIGASTDGWLGPAVAAARVYHAWVGAVTDTAATVAYGLENVASTRLVVSTNADLSAPVYSPAAAVDSAGVVKLTRTELTPNTDYYFGVEADGVLMVDGRGSFTSDPTPGVPTSVSVVFGSCQQTNSNAVTFAKMANRVGPYGRARRALHEGDMHYRDPGAGFTAADVRAQYRSSLAQPNMQVLLTTVPTTYEPDNHDWGGADSHAGSPAGPVVAAGFRQFVPHYALPAPDGVGMWQSFVLGRIRFIILDTRSQRSPRTDPDGPSKTLLGAAQKAWFFSELEKPEPLKIIVSGIYWRLDSATGDRWGSYYTEWAEIRAWFAAHPQVQAYVVFGDRHALAADDGSSPNCYLPMAGGAPFDQGSTQSFEPWSHGYYEGVANTNLKAYGALDITDSGASISVAYSGISANDDVVRVSMTTTFTASAALPAVWGMPL
ncbi:alkaline phosphatase D family protein [Micromonospora sp. STR1s_5]|nr:alkaline phosphatase D family protein [Micromonospora sp. STR1s_5]